MKEEEKGLIDPMIMYDKDEKPKLVKLMDFDVPTKSFEEKTYIVLYRISGSKVDDFDGLFEVYTGRTETYNSIKNHLISGIDIDIHESKIITEVKLTDNDGDKKYFLIPFNECISIYAFFNSVQSYYGDDEFNIEDYNTTKVDKDEDEEKIQMTKEQQEYESMILESLKTDKFGIYLGGNSNKANNV